jgi:transposase
MTTNVEFFIPGRLGLTIKEKEKLRKFSRNEQGREAIRALIIIWFDEGKTEKEIADLLFVSVRTVRRCIRRYKKENIEGLHDKEKSGRPRKADENVEKTVEEAMKKNPEEVGYKSGFWITRLLCVYLFTMSGILLSDSTVRRVLHRLDYVFRRPKLWSGPSGENPPEIKKALEEVKKTKQCSFIRMKQASISCLY